jgi:uncharacterized protein (TIGR02302 family)
MPPDPDRDDNRHAPPLRRLARRRWLARSALLFEGLWPALWPPLGVAGLFVCLALFDLPRVLPPWPHALLLLGFGLAIAWLLIRGLARLPLPDRAAADRRLERATGLAHRPLAALTDRPAIAGADALWRTHVARAAAQVRRLKVGLPRPGLAAQDRRALRGGLVVALVAGAIVAGGDAPDRLARAFSPGFPPRPVPPAPLLQAWITPPAYTGVAPLFLKAEGPAELAVPAASHLTVSVTGGTGRPSLLLNGHPDPFKPLDATSFQIERDLSSGGRLAVRRNGREIAGWDLTVIADAPPTAQWTDQPGRAARGLRVRLPWRASDDYGVIGLQAEFRLRDRPDASPLVVPIPLPGGTPKTAHGTGLEDLTANPWAGLPVVAHLVARDAPGQTGTSADAELVLPERDFQNPVARALVAVRKALSRNPDRRLAAVQDLDRLSDKPEPFGSDFGAYLNLRAIASLLRDNPGRNIVPEAQARLWQLALHMEEGAVERTARALEQARQQLREAMDRQAQGQPVDPKRLDQLMQQLQQALREHLEALAEEARRDRSELPFDARTLDPRELERLAQEMRDAANQGRMEDARAREQELERQLQALRQAQQQHQHGNKAAQRQRGQQEMSALQDLVQREGGLLDHAQARAVERDQQPGDAPEQPAVRPMPRYGRDADPKSEAAAAQADAQRRTDQQVQQALRRALGELMQQLSDLTGDLPKGLGEADKDMEESASNLGQGSDQKAGAAQQRAIEALQQGGREAARQMAQMFGNQSGEDEQGEEGDQASESDSLGQSGTMSDQGNGSQPMAGGEGHGQRRGKRDPLGRLTEQGTSGADESSDVTVPDQMEQVRTRTLEQELRRRGAERQRPKEELDYIDRLLKQF